MTREEQKQIADTILQQLGGSRFMMMTGAKHLTFDDKGALSFKLTMGPFNHVRIETNALDLYTVTFTKYRKFDILRTEIVDNVYDDLLVGVFESKTGLCTSLGTMGRRQA